MSGKNMDFVLTHRVKLIDLSSLKKIEEHVQ